MKKCTNADHGDVDAVVELWWDEDDSVGWYPYCEACATALGEDYPRRPLHVPDVEDYRRAITAAMDQVDQGPFVPLPQFTNVEAQAVLDCINLSWGMWESAGWPAMSEMLLNSLRTAFAEAVANHHPAV